MALYQLFHAYLSTYGYTIAYIHSVHECTHTYIIYYMPAYHHDHHNHHHTTSPNTTTTATTTAHTTATTTITTTTVVVVVIVIFCIIIISLLSLLSTLNNFFDKNHRHLLLGDWEASVLERLVALCDPLFFCALTSISKSDDAFEMSSLGGACC